MTTAPTRDDITAAIVSALPASFLIRWAELRRTLPGDRQQQDQALDWLVHGSGAVHLVKVHGSPLVGRALFPGCACCAPSPRHPALVIA